MSWYAASLIYVFRFREEVQKRFLVWEDVCLVEADSEAAAKQKAEELGRARELDDETRTLDGKPARLDFAGVRKLLTIENPDAEAPSAEPPRHGTEITFSEFTVDGAEDLEKLIKGLRVSVIYEE